MFKKKRGRNLENELESLEGPNMNRNNALDYNEKDTSFDDGGGLGGEINEDLVDKSFSEEDELE